MGVVFRLTTSISTDDTVWRVRVTPDGSRLVSYTPAGITVRRIPDGAIVWNIPTGGYFALSPDGQLLVTAGSNSIITRSPSERSRCRMALGRTTRITQPFLGFLLGHGCKLLESTLAMGKVRRMVAPLIIRYQ